MDQKLSRLRDGISVFFASRSESIRYFVITCKINKTLLTQSKSLSTQIKVLVLGENLDVNFNLGNWQRMPEKPVSDLITLLSFNKVVLCYSNLFFVIKSLR